MITARAHGIDLSKWDVSFDPTKATEQLDFVVQRASYRITKDELFDALNVGVQKVPVRLAYHYLNSDTAWSTQYDKFMSVVADKNFHAYVVDFESAFNVMSPEFAKMAWDFAKRVVTDTGKRCLLYTNFYGYRDYLIPSQTKYGINWNNVDLWIAQYWTTPNPNAVPNLPDGRVGWNMWQYTDKGNGALYGTGRSTACDLNVFNGTLDDMKKFLGITTPAPTTDNPTVTFTFNFQGKTWEAANVELKPKA